MKNKLIKLQDKFILVSDEEMKENDTALDLCEDMGTKFESFIVDKATLKYANQECKKIVSKNPDFSLLSEADCKTIGWYDVEKLAIRRYGMSIYSIEEVEAFISGFKTAQSLNDKMFSLEDVRKAIKKTRGSDEPMESIIQSLQQTSWDVEINELNQITKIL